MIFKHVFVCFLSFFHGLSYCQDNTDYHLEKYLESIEVLIDKQASDTELKFEEQRLLAQRSNASGVERIQACLDLFTYYIYKSTDRAKTYNDEAILLSTRLGLDKENLRSNLNQAFIFFIKGEFDQATLRIEHLQSEKGLHSFPEIKADCEILQSYIYTERGEYDVALKNALDILEIGEKSQNPYILMRAFSAISHVYLRLGEYEKALENCLKGLDFILELEKTQYLFPKIDELARMTHKLEGSEKAAKIYDFYLRMENKLPEPGSYIQSVVYMNIASIYTAERHFEKAELFLTKALQLIDQNNYRFRKPRAYALMAELRTKMLDTVRAIDNYEKGFYAARAIKANDMIKSISGSLSSLYRSRGDTLQASKFSELYAEVSDSLFTVETEQRIKILESRRKISEISKEKEILEIRGKSQEERYRLTVLILVLTFASGAIATLSYYKVKKKNRLLFDRTKELALEKLSQKKLLLQPAGAYSHASETDDGPKTDYIDDDIRDIIMAKLERLEEEHFFLNPKCSLSMLAEEVQTNQKYLSLVINHEKKSNFNNYINGLRVDHLLNRLLEDEEFRNSKLSFIATASGFNNSNTFYSAFKKRLGILPSYFIKQLNEEKS